MNLFNSNVTIKTWKPLPIVLCFFLTGVLCCTHRESVQLKTLIREISQLKSEVEPFPLVFTPPQATSAGEERLVDIIVRLQSLLRKNSKNPEIEWNIGECQRLGYYLGLPSAWSESERHLQMALAIDPNFYKANLSLGLLYFQTGPEFAAKAEQKFREAIAGSKDAPLPEAQKGLFYSCVYQGRFSEAVKHAEKYSTLRPDDMDFEKARNLAKSHLERQGKASPQSL